MGKSQSIKMNKVLKENEQLRTEIAALKKNINELEDAYNHRWEIATVAKHSKYSTNADKCSSSNYNAPPKSLYFFYSFLY